MSKIFLYAYWWPLCFSMSCTEQSGMWVWVTWFSCVLFSFEIIFRHAKYYSFYAAHFPSFFSKFIQVNIYPRYVFIFPFVHFTTSFQTQCFLHLFQLRDILDIQHLIRNGWCLSSQCIEAIPPKPLCFFIYPCLLCITSNSFGFSIPQNRFSLFWA